MKTTDTWKPVGLKQLRAQYFKASSNDEFRDSEAMHVPPFPTLPAGWSATRDRLPGVYKVTKGACSQYIHWDRGAWRDGDSSIWEVPSETV